MAHVIDQKSIKSQDTMAEWLRRQIRISLAICFPLGAQVQILLVSSFSLFLLAWLQSVSV